MLADCLSPPGGPLPLPWAWESPLGDEREEEVTELCGEKTGQQMQAVE